MEFCQAARHWRQALHLEPPDGWLNDPNGLSWFAGKWQVYFQYSPGTADGSAPRCWGHFESPDLLHWQYTGTPLCPDTAWDKNGVYSGSAAAAGDALHLFYTGNVKQDGDFDYITAGRGANVIHVVTADGRTAGPKQLLLTNANYPADCTCHVRDPKVWQAAGVWNMVLGARVRPAVTRCADHDRGAVLLYRAPAPEGPWVLAATLQSPEKKGFGYMWECPDWFLLDGRGVLSVSPQGLPHGRACWQNTYQSGWFPLALPAGPLPENARLNVEPAAFTEWDMGFDFYAPQTMAAPDGRRLLVGWMGVPDAPYHCPTAAFGWQHCLTLPRELHWDAAGNLCQAPARELLALRGPGAALTPGTPARYILPLELEAALPADPADFSLTLAGGLVLRYDAAEKLVTLAFTDPALSGGRTVRRAVLAGCHSLRVIADTSSVEYYLNDGACVFSTRFFPPEGPVAVEWQGSAAATVYPLRGMEVLP